MTSKTPPDNYTMSLPGSWSGNADDVARLGPDYRFMRVFEDDAFKHSDFGTIAPETSPVTQAETHVSLNDNTAFWLALVAAHDGHSPNECVELLVMQRANAIGPSHLIDVKQKLRRGGK